MAGDDEDVAFVFEVRDQRVALVTDRTDDCRHG
jgi:hypothetical protein